MTKQVKSSFQIIGGRIIYSGKTFESDFNAMKLDNEGAAGEVNFEILDKPEHYQYKYFHGFLLPDIACALGETDTEYVKQFVLKPKFLFYPLPDGDFRKIPSKHMSGCRVCTGIRNGEEVVIGYIPSTGKITYDEMDKFIKDCENFLMFDMKGSVGMSAGINQNTVQVEALKMRGMAQKIN